MTPTLTFVQSHSSRLLLELSPGEIGGMSSSLPVNAWWNLPNAEPFVLPRDHDAVTKFNKSADYEHRVHVNLLPESHLPSPDAPVVLLTLNRRFGDESVAVHALFEFEATPSVAPHHESGKSYGIPRSSFLTFPT